MDAPILKTPGEILAEARDAAGLTLARLAEITKIPVRQLESIERDEYHKLSGPLYVKSFLRAYADAVGVEAATVLELYARSSGERPQTAPGVGADVWSENTVTITRVGLPWARLAALAAGLVLATVVVWWLVQAFGGGTAEPAPRAVVTGPVAVPETLREPSADTTAEAVRTRDAPRDSLARSFGLGPPPPPARAARGSADLPPAVDGADAALAIGGRTWPLRLRLLTLTPLRIRVKGEGESAFRETTVPRDGAAPPLPAAGVEPGLVYAAREGFVAYWGADEYVEFGLDRVDGVEITINGEPCDVAGLAPESTKLLHVDNYPTRQRR